MIKTLQKKFIFTAMIAISVLLAVLLGGINIFNIQTNIQQSEELLKAVVQEETDSIISMITGSPYLGGIFSFSDNATRSAAYFTVYTDNAGNILATDVSNIRNLSKREAEKIAAKIAENKESGVVGNYRYTSVQNINGYFKAYIFLDIYTQKTGILVILFLSVIIGVICWFLMLLLVIVLSKKAILPIAENMEKQKRFVTDAGHEIKTPLAIIMANTEAMELHNGENKWSNNIKSQVNRLDSLTKNMLTLAKADEGKENIPEEDVNVSECVRKNVEMFKEPAKLKDITLFQDISDEIHITANTEYISRIASILLDNAVKYTKSEGEIYVALSKYKSGFELTVSNTYDGSDTDTEKFFDRFYRSDKSRTQSGGGYGIGLSAARTIAELYNGSVTAQIENKHIIFKVRI